MTLFLQVLDDGRLTDGQGRVVDFRNTVIIMTSNLGAAFLNDMGEGPVKPETRRLVMSAIQSHFPPEFVNRVDEIIVFVSFLLSLPAVWNYILIQCFLNNSAHCPGITSSRLSIFASKKSRAVLRNARSRSTLTMTPRPISLLSGTRRFTVLVH